MKTPTSFWLISIILLIWNILGVMAFFAQVMVSEEAVAMMPAVEKALYAKYTLWTYIVFALAVFTGLAAAVFLVLKKQLAKSLFIVSIIAVFIQMGHSIFIAKAMEVYGTNALIMPGLVILIGLYSVYFTNSQINKGIVL